MIHDNIQIILYVTGTITASMLLQFVAPARNAVIEEVVSRLTRTS